MMTLLELLYVAWFAIVAPVIDYVVFWPAFRRRSDVDPGRARRWLWTRVMLHSWLVVAVGAALWAASDRASPLEFSAPSGWRLWAFLAGSLLLAAYHAMALVILARSAEARVTVRSQIGKLATLMPHTRAELARFGGVALTAGFCEEVLYRGFFIWVFSPWLGWWGAAALSLPCFAIAHLAVYRSWNGVVRTGLVGALYTLIVASSGSLWPAIALHALLDLGAGMMAWMVLREDGSAGNQRPEP